MLNIGDEVVIFFLNNPVTHNEGPHDTRGKIIKITKTYYFVSSRKAPFKIRIDGSDGWSVLSIPEAKVKYRSRFGGPREYRTPEFINQLVENL